MVGRVGDDGEADDGHAALAHRLGNALERRADAEDAAGMAVDVDGDGAVDQRARSRGAAGIGGGDGRRAVVASGERQRGTGGEEATPRYRSAKRARRRVDRRRIAQLIAPARRIVVETAQPAGEPHRPAERRDRHAREDLDCAQGIARQAADAADGLRRQPEIGVRIGDFGRRHPADQLDLGAVQRVDPVARQFGP